MDINQNKLCTIKPFALLFIIIVAIYSNTLHSSWHLDDYQNIIKNTNVHLTQFDLHSIKSSFYASPAREGLDRPLSYFTFALNWYWGQDNVTGYHVVNIAIHFLAASFLFLVILLLFRTPNLRGWGSNDIYFVALLSALLWAIHPIQTQAVTYIVQRMASMAALFYIIGIFCYLKARLTLSSLYRIIFWILCGVAFLLGIASKNNAILLPVFLLLMEIIFFRDLSQSKTQRQALGIFLGGVFLMATVGVILFMKGNMSGIFEGYETRPFSLYQRLLTQPSIILFYLSQIFYPIADRFSISHDFVIANSLFSPWTTLPSIFIIVSLIGLALWCINKNCILAFAILFFFGNHAIESTIIPLEMIFEHRNYLPTSFLFIPISIGIKKILDHYSLIRNSMFIFLIFSLCVVIVGIGTSTYIRNLSWHSPKSLWENAMEKSPESGRPLHNLAWGYYEPTGQIEKAIQLYHTAIQLSFDKREYRADPYNNLAAIYYLEFSDYKKAFKYASKAIEINPAHDRANLLFCYALGKLGRYDEALTHLNNLIAKYPKNVDFIYIKGSILLQINRPEDALEAFKKCMQLSPVNWRYLREIGYSLTEMKHYHRGQWFLKRAESIYPKEVGILLGMASNRLRAGKPDEAAKYINQFINMVGVENTESTLRAIDKDPLGLPVFFDGVVPLVLENIRERSVKFSEIAAKFSVHFTSDR